MAQIYPFRALRYDTSKVAMADVVTQPYDKITPAMQDAYYRNSPYNLIRIVLGKQEPGDDDSHNVYTRAAETYHAWRAEGVLEEEPEPAIFGYSQTYAVPGTEEVRERRGFIALGHLYDYADRVVFRHEQTFPKHKSDRLALFKALRAYPEQIYMLYSDPQFTAEHLLFDTPSGEPKPADLEIKDEYGVVHRVWKLTDPTLIGTLVESMRNKQLIIADGHHRYETSVAYMHEQAEKLGLEPVKGDAPLADTFNDVVVDAHKDETALSSPPFPEAAMMMTFVNMDAPGITILPTHRVVFGLQGFNGKEFGQQAESLFDVETIGQQSDEQAGDAERLLARLNESPGTAFVAVTRDGDFLLRPKRDAVKRMLSPISPRQAELDVVQLHKLILEHMLNLHEEKVRAGENVRYLREAADAIEQVRSGKADVAFLIKPVTLQQMKDISLHLEVMPQKSTDFYPKLLSGLAMYALD